MINDQMQGSNTGVFRSGISGLFSSELMLAADQYNDELHPFEFEQNSLDEFHFYETPSLTAKIDECDVDLLNIDDPPIAELRTSFDNTILNLQMQLERRQELQNHANERIHDAYRQDNAIDDDMHMHKLNFSLSILDVNSTSTMNDFSLSDTILAHKMNLRRSLDTSSIHWDSTDNIDAKRHELTAEKDNNEEHVPLPDAKTNTSILFDAHENNRLDDIHTNLFSMVSRLHSQLPAQSTEHLYHVSVDPGDGLSEFSSDDDDDEGFRHSTMRISQTSEQTQPFTSHSVSYLPRDINTSSSVDDEWNTSLELVRDLDAQLGREEEEEEEEEESGRDNQINQTDYLSSESQATAIHHHQQQYIQQTHTPTDQSWSNQLYVPQPIGFYNNHAHIQPSAPFYENHPPSSQMVCSVPLPSAPLHERVAHLDKMRRQREAFLFT